MGSQSRGRLCRLERTGVETTPRASSRETRPTQWLPYEPVAGSPFPKTRLQVKNA
ncbi:hypothetical protein H6G76_21250 [Nostoc sp. FACHB-152]|uniref:hypothetical protein n=1 Tax=unclassified Nostoc TaxID=2593658 RepID=UPI0016820A56|nr:MULTISPECIES: hypothetical protein [unclassified Nostoc]MBD2449648.1 hypothetical protein [Nostoc sp. FACHB-152]MBD2469688.1 hypothetical protein [Nostoc sp. FACHB-145]